MDATHRAEVESRIGYRFRDAGLLSTAFRHSGYAKDSGQGHLHSNQRLEFLGDSVIGLLVAEWFYRDRPGAPEGELTCLKGRYVSKVALAAACAELGLGEFLELSPGEEGSGGRERSSNLADLFEALLGAIYLDSGLEEARDFIRRHLIDCDRVSRTETLVEPKSALQEAVLARLHELPEYEVIGRDGPDHRPTFTVAVRIHGRVAASAVGPSKQAAEREAARMALRALPELLACTRG